jgi:hypothetical protein
MRWGIFMSNLCTHHISLDVLNALGKISFCCVLMQPGSSHSRQHFNQQRAAFGLSCLSEEKAHLTRALLGS